jgi:hypothetical protein
LSLVLGSGHGRAAAPQHEAESGEHEERGEDGCEEEAAAHQTDATAAEAGAAGT